MFIYSIRASTIKFFAVVVICIAGLVGMIALSGNSAAYASAGGVEINYGGIKSEEDRIAFIKGFGLSVDADSVKSENVTFPDEFDIALNTYNEIQKTQGLDLTKYRNKRITHYTYTVTNYDHDGTVYVNLYVYKNKVVGCDVSSADPQGFVLALGQIDEAKLKQ